MPASSPCSRLTAQWTAGAAAAIPTPCETDNRTFEAAATTFTTPVLEKDTEATGIVSADVFAELTSTDATLVAVVSDVKPDGSSEQITSGFLLASQRAIDVRRSTKGRSGRILRPFHPFTKASQEPVVPNEAERYRIDIYPTSHVFQAGHRIRLTIATANTPTTFTPVPAMTPQLGGEIRFLHGPRYPSRLVLPLR
jgi:putative CocE/NonD family hydrolase